MPSDLDFQSCAFEIAQEIGRLDSWDYYVWEEIIIRWCDYFGVRIPTEEPDRGER
ncbi:unnamed protein product, partial [marine sediment metagenome]